MCRYYYFIAYMLVVSSQFFISLVYALPEKALPLSQAKWSIMNMIQADNNLAPFADLNVQSMKDGMVPTSQVNIIVIWDKPSENRTNRLKISAGAQTDDGSSSSELGVQTEKEVYSHFARTVQRYPADHYGLILWDHGSGIEDLESGGFTPRKVKDRGILYDYSQGTFLNNQGLSMLCSQIKTLLGRKIDFIGMDACFMAMLEVAYQVKNYADYLVGSVETEPSEGWAYQLWLNALTLNPSMSTRTLAQNLVTTYKTFYDQRTEPRYTQSALDLSFCDQVKDNVDQLARVLLACAHVDADWTRLILGLAQSEADGFDQAEYMDLYSFYEALFQHFEVPARAFSSEPDATRKIFFPKRRGKPSSKKLGRRLSLTQKQYYDMRLEKRKKLHALAQEILVLIDNGRPLIEAMVPFSVTGVDHVRSRGLSIYFPFPEQGLHPSYIKTDFWRDTRWGQLIQFYVG